ncbi:hypothetical protein HELRODRAFT_188954 [Helobdella robusta]|uniref:Polypeptide N-acetylgalactosaminyltransferase n=1 Tax=Helobdella robusta TaxID=6412 RepID=T1FQI0_HELRO|nr:hypothetical protein HELRODRAFT_188954 [Helobdella robusta]ESN98915.1 hypothetical protein HELRODRAFT_188954 [Helobdella robusta]
MKRNAITIAKYLFFAAFLLTLGPVVVKFFLGDAENGFQKTRLKFHKANLKGALPVDPDDLNKIFEPREWTVPVAMKSEDLTPIKKHLPTPVPFQKKPEEHDGHSDDLKDWHNYEAIEEELRRTGPGEQGVSVILGPEDEEKKKDLYSVNGFNALASDKISLDRAIKDIRHPDCRKKKYRPKLLNASIVVPFHNEHWSTLLRTVKSVLNRSPPELLHEIILVDDFSSKEHCKKQLDDHLAQNYGGKVKVIHQTRREGLIRTRITGAKAAMGQVLIFLDSHVEANVNWLPPLLDPITENYKTVVCPFIDVIDYENFAYRAQDEGARGAFDWEFFYKRLPLLKKDLQNPSQPFKSPVMAGGLFAISTKWFWELGGYDPGLDIWGGEQYELSFKIWQCGGTMVDAPCSRVGHIYRKFAPFPNPGIGDFIARNYKRVAEVWMDEYKEFLYARRPHYRTADMGDVSQQLAVRERLHCKPFRWFMAKIAFDLPLKYPMVEPPNVGEGELQNVEGKLCVDLKFASENSRFQLETCRSADPKISGEQQLQLTWHRDIRPRGRSVCFDVSKSDNKSPVILYTCHGMQGNQWWKYNVDTQQLLHPVSNLCLDCDAERKEIFMNPCDPEVKTQRWKWSVLNKEQARKEWYASKFEDTLTEPADDANY